MMGLWIHHGLWAENGKGFTPTASFTFVTDCEDEAISFTNTSSTSSGTIEFYSWDFGDGSGSTAQFPIHVFQNPGTFPVRLTIRDSNGLTDSDTQFITIAARPTVDFSVPPTSVCEGVDITFTNMTSITSGTIDSYLWDFGDMSTATTVNASHTYGSAGTFTVSLTAIANGSCETILTREVEISPLPVVAFEVDDVCLGTALEITNRTNISEGNLTYNWDFQDGTTDNNDLKEPAHEYGSIGQFNLTLTATSQIANCSSNASQIVRVNPVPEVDFTLDDHCLESPPVIINNSSIDMGTIDYSWDFGDGNISVQEVPDHEFEFPGSYQVNLLVTSNLNCKADLTDFVSVYPEPIADFTTSNACVSDLAQFTNNSSVETGSISYLWNFGDGGTSIEENPSHQYIVPNVYTVTLRVTTNEGCFKTVSKSITIEATSIGGTIAGARTICENDPTLYQLDLLGHRGEVLQWESSETGDSPWTILSNLTDRLSYSGLNESTYFRALVGNGLCVPVFSDTVLISVDQNTIPGVLSGATTVCGGTNTGVLSLAGHFGTILEWQRSTTGSDPWVPFANVNTTFTFSDLNETTYYRARVRNGVCAEAFSNVVKVEVSPMTEAGVLSPSGTFCRGDNNGILTLINEIGDIQRWEFSNTGDAPWSVINNTTNEQTYTDLLASTYYRVIVRSGSCDEEISNVIKITIDEPTVAGEIRGIDAVCDQENEGQLTLNGNLGDILRWELSTDDPSENNWTSIANSTNQQDFVNINTTTYYRALVRKGVCDEEFTAPFKVTVNALPELAFSAESVCVGNQTVFQNSSSIASGIIESYFWDFGGGNVSVAENPTFSFVEPGIYPVTLTATATGGCSATITNFIEVFTNTVADFLVDNVCVGISTVFIQNSQLGGAPISAYDWYFGDWNVSTEAAPTHLYEEDGEYAVSLTITNENRCRSTITKMVEIYERAVPEFSFENVCDGQPVSFTNTSFLPNNENQFLWSFGDGETLTSSDALHLYGAADEYSVNLQVTTSNGCVNDLTNLVTVNEQPRAGFRAENVCLGVPITFTDTTVFSGAGLTYHWDFDNGTVSDEQSPVITYDESGQYRVTQTVTSANGCTSMAEGFFDVRPIPEVSFRAINACRGQAITFENLSPQNIEGLTYSWDFGDGEVSAEFNPSHVYADIGSFTVTLTGNSPFGCSLSTTKEVTVFAIPQPDFSFEDVCDGLPVSFTNLSDISTGRINEILWDFGDMTNSIFEEPIKQYLNPGSFQVTLTTTSDNGCINDLTKTVTVFENPIADFRADNECFGTPIAFENLARNFGEGVLSSSWDFGNGENSSAAEPAINYAIAGNYNAKLLVTTENGCQDSIQRRITVFEPPSINVSRDTSISQGFSVELLATGASTYTWSPSGLLDNSNIANPVATPLETTDFTVIAFDENGCEGSDTLTITVTEDFRLEVNNTFTPDGNGKNDFWVIDNIETFSGDAHVRVFNRHGRLVFEDRAYDNDWAGTSQGDLLPDGSYFYLVTFATSKQIYRGTITIIRND